MQGYVSLFPVEKMYYLLYISAYLEKILIEVLILVEIRRYSLTEEAYKRKISGIACAEVTNLRPDEQITVLSALIIVTKDEEAV